MMRYACTRCAGALYRMARPVLFMLPPETAHRLALGTVRAGLFTDNRPDDPILETELWGRRMRNPLGLAAGFDKNAVALRGLSRMGFGFIEVGGVTPRPQSGNAKPRLFRDAGARAIINRFGLNNDGGDMLAARLRAYRQDIGLGGPPIAINLGPNADSPDPQADFRAVSARLSPLADILVVNVSSPNTAGLRDWQASARLEGVLAAVEAGVRQDTKRPVILVKLAPDMPAGALEAIADLALSRPVDGLCLTNTTTSRPLGLSAQIAAQAGGLSGAPLKPIALEALRRVASITKGRIPLIGTGGIETGEDAYRRIRAGASLVQIYSALVFSGPALIATLKHDLAARLRADGFSHISQAVGVDLPG